MFEKVLLYIFTEKNGKQSLTPEDKKIAKHKEKRKNIGDCRRKCSSRENELEVKLKMIIQ